VDTSGLPSRRLAALTRYGMAGKAAALRDLGPSRRAATLLATVHHLIITATDDALDLLDVLMATKLLARAERATNNEKLRSLPRLARASTTLKAVVVVLIGAPEADQDGQVMTLVEVWNQIEAVVSRSELAAAMMAIEELTPAADSDDNEAWRAELTKRYAVVWAVPVAAQRGHRLRRCARGPGDPGSSWRRLVYTGPDLEPGTIDRRPYTFCVLEALHRALRRRDVFAPGSARWADPRAKLLDSSAWAKVKDATLTSLDLPDDPDATWPSSPPRSIAPTEL